MTFQRFATRITAILVAALLGAACGAMPAAISTQAAPTEAVSAGVVATDGAPTPVPTATTRPTVEATPSPAPAVVLRDPPPAESLPDVTLEVELFYAERWMRVRQTVDLTNDSGEPWTEVVFNAPMNYISNAFFLDALNVTLGDVTTAVEPAYYDLTILHVVLPQTVEPGESIHIEMGYRVVIPPINKTSWPPVGTTGWTPEVIQAGDWVVALAPYAPGEGWQTVRYYPVGDPTYYPLVNYHMNLTTEEGIVVASGGPVHGVGGLPGLGEEGVWHFHTDRARGLAFIASDNYEVLIDESGEVPIYSVFYSEHADAGRTALEIARQSVELFTELYGPYPYDSLVVAENGFFGGMEYTALASITDYAYSTYTGSAPSLLHALVSHEIAHQWWYGSVGNNQAEEPWLDESLAFYSELLYFERYIPDETDWWWQKRVDQYSPAGAVNATIYEFEDSPSFILLTYGQAARFVRDLRALMDDEAFFAFLRDYYAAHAWSTVTATDYLAAIRAHTDEDITPLLEQYFSDLPADEPAETEEAAP